MPDLSICIVSWNVSRYLKGCLHSLYGYRHDCSFEVIVVDNNSEDDSVEMVKINFPQVNLIENAQNIGFPAANNQAIKRCRGTYILFLNPDTLVFPPTLSGMIKFMSDHPDAGIATCKQLKEKGVISLEYNTDHRPFSWKSHRHLKDYLWRLLRILSPGNRLFRTLPSNQVPDIHFKGIQGNIPFETDFVMGSFLMTRQDVLSKVGLLDERFFLHYDDFDFCYRVRQNNFKIYLCPQFEIIHYTYQSTGQCEQNKILNISNYCHSLLIGKHKGKIYLFLKIIPEIVCILAELIVSRVSRLIFYKKKDRIEALEKEFTPDGIISIYVKNLLRVTCLNFQK